MPIFSTFPSESDLEVRTPGNALAADLLLGKTAWVKGNHIVGEMPNFGSWSSGDLIAGNQINIPKGFHDGSGKVIAASLLAQTSGTAVSADILSGKTAWVNGTNVSGIMSQSVADVKLNPSQDNRSFSGSGYYTSIKVECDQKLSTVTVVPNGRSFYLFYLAPVSPDPRPVVNFTNSYFNCVGWGNDTRTFTNVINGLIVLIEQQGSMFNQFNYSSPDCIEAVFGATAIVSNTWCDGYTVNVH